MRSIFIRRAPPHPITPHSDNFTLRVKGFTLYERFGFFCVCFGFVSFIEPPYDSHALGSGCSPYCCCYG